MNDFNRALKELQQGNFSDGMVILEKLLEDDPDNTVFLYNLGMCYSEIGMAKKSIAVLEKCLALEPRSANNMVALGIACSRAGDDAKAAAVLRDALELEPDNIYALQNLGMVYCMTGDTDGAYACFTKADQLSPENPQVALGLARVFELKKEFNAATKLYLQVKASSAPAAVTRSAIEGVNRVAMEKLKDEGQGYRIDVIRSLLSAIELFARVSADKVKEISFEIAILGEGGLAINDPDIRYTLKSMDGEFTGMQLLCYMFAGLKIIDSSLPPIADLEEEYNQAIKQYRSRLDEH